MYRPLTDAFTAAIKGSDGDVDLLNAALLIAGLGRPRIELAGYRKLLDILASDVQKRAGEGAGPLPTVDAIDHELFYAQGFHGNASRYNDPENSYLDRVIERRTGIPITLSLVYMEVAKRVGLRCDGIGYPGHFIVRCGEPDDGIYVDPFHQGARLDREELLAGLRGRDLGGASPESFLAAVTQRQILQRMLNNLRSVFCEQADIERWLGTVDLALCLEPWNTDLIGERGMLRYRLGAYDLALDDLERYAGVNNGGPGHPAAFKILEALRERLGRQEGLR